MMVIKKKILIGLLLILFLLLVVILINNYAKIYMRLYCGDRITGTYSITVNGKSVQSDEYYAYENGGKIRLESDTENFKIKGGAYGIYKIGFMIDKERLYELTSDPIFQKYENDIDLSVSYYNTNWWHITTIDIPIEFVKENDEWYIEYDIRYSEPDEYGSIHSYSQYKKVALYELHESEICFGS